MKLDTNREGDGSFVSLKISGALELDDAETLCETIARSDSPSLTLDMSEATACDLTAMQIFVAAAKSARQKKTLFSIVQCSEAVLLACAAVGIPLAEMNIAAA
jgi:anti-anti-sigma regulatory factor